MKRNESLKVARAAALAAGVALSAAAHAALDPNLFEVGWPLDVPTQGGYFDVPLTQDVYRHAPALEQLAVLDARNEPMPFYRVPVDPPSTGEQRVTLGVSPVYVSQPAGALGQLSVSTDDRRTSVALTRPADGPRTDVSAFVVDARAVERPPGAVELEWRALPQPFLLDVRVEQSDDLANWRPVGRGSVAQLAVGGAEARHTRVAVSARAGGYLRIGWERNVADFYLERVALVSAETAEPSLQSVRLPALDRAPPPSRDQASAPAPLYFDAGGPVPVATATVRFVSGSGWLTADVAVADSLDGPWLPVAYQSLFYDVEYSGTRFASTPIAARRIDKRYWRLVPAESTDRSRVELEVRFPQELLRVAATGSPPYLLAAGTRSGDAGPDATFAAVWRRLDPAPAPARASLGTMRDLGGAASLIEPVVFPWRTAALWVVLVFGVVAVAFMAVRLAREMHDKPSSR